jgi:hypothetical protein
MSTTVEREIAAISEDDFTHEEDYIEYKYRRDNGLLSAPMPGVRIPGLPGNRVKKLARYSEEKRIMDLRHKHYERERIALAKRKEEAVLAEREAICRSMPRTISRDIALAKIKYGYGPTGFAYNMYHVRYEMVPNDDEKFAAFRKALDALIQTPHKFVIEYTNRAMLKKASLFDFLWRDMFAVPFPEDLRSILKKSDFVRMFYQDNEPLQLLDRNAREKGLRKGLRPLDPL